MLRAEAEGIPGFCRRLLLFRCSPFPLPGRCRLGCSGRAPSPLLPASLLPFLSALALRRSSLSFVRPLPLTRFAPIFATAVVDPFVLAGASSEDWDWDVLASRIPLRVTHTVRHMQQDSFRSKPSHEKREVGSPLRSRNTAMCLIAHLQTHSHTHPTSLTARVRVCVPARVCCPLRTHHAAACIRVNGPTHTYGSNISSVRNTHAQVLRSLDHSSLAWKTLKTRKGRSYYFSGPARSPFTV